MKIHFNNKDLKIKKLYFPLKTKYFSGCVYLIESLNKKGIRYVKDLPEDLSELKKIEGVGQKRIKRLFDQILLYERTIEDTEYLIYKEKVVFPIKILNVPTSTLVCPRPVMDFLKDANIKRIGELPSDFAAFKNVKQIGNVSVKKLAEELVRVKELHKNKRMFVLSRKNILLPKTFKLSGRLSKEFDYRLEDLPIDLRPFEKEPGFDDFIYKLKEAIRVHEEENAIDDFRNTFNKLLNGQGVIGISDKYAKIISLRFNESLPSLQAVGDEVGLTRERIRQIVNLVLTKILRHYNISITKDVIGRKLHRGEEKFLKELMDKNEVFKKRRGF